MKPYKYLEHTADVKFQAFGKTLEEAFSNAALASFNVITDTAKVEPRITKEVKVESNTKESLLYDFLEELLFLLDAEGFLLHEIRDLSIAKNKKFSLKCKAIGDRYTTQEVYGNIKSITYSEMFIKKQKGLYVLQVVLDI
jgi:SHS2 domain-containing protein